MTRITPAATTKTAIALFVLWGLSWWASFYDLGAWSLVVALGIAAAKAVLVVLFFMEIILEKTSIHATLLTGLAMIAILLFFMIADVRTRAVPPLLPPAAHVAARAG